MENPLQRERSLKKLHLCIANYRPSPEDHSALHNAQQELRDKIELKFRRSTANQSYVFPRRVTSKEEYSDGNETISLHAQPEAAGDSELRQKPKIKLAKGRAEKRLQTDHDENAAKARWEERKAQYHSRPFAESSQNYPALTVPLKQRVRTEHSREQSRKLEPPPFLNSLQRQGLSRGKSKLNMLTKSYMNLKSGKPLECSAEQAANSIRTTHDYKFMPSSTNHRAHNNNPAGFNSTREFKVLAHEPDPRSLEKLEALLPSRKGFRGK